MTGFTARMKLQSSKQKKGLQSARYLRAVSCRQAAEQGLSCQAGYMVDGAKSAVEQVDVCC